jgi:DnaJ-class molecular chaperone
MSMKQMCPACKGRRTDGNGRTCRACQGAGEIETKSKSVNATQKTPESVKNKPS